MENKTYILNVGEAARERLAMQHELVRSESEDLLDRAGIKPGMKVLEVGCGVGMMSAVIAEKIGPAGQLTAIDVSAEQIEQAQHYTKKQNLNNIEYINVDILNDKPTWHNQFDLVYTRFVLGHVKDATKAMSHMKSFLKDGGIMVCEEATIKEAYCDPYSVTFDRIIDLIRELRERYGASSQGHQIYHHYLDLNFKDININLHQPVLTTEAEKNLITMAIMEITPRLIEEKLIDESEADKLIKDLTEIAKSPAIIAYFRITQIYGKKGVRS